ncbi:hypothetical protein CWE15_08450 [Aliidiomarina taiwanensis]|uniref:DUF2231 domain-containing protein n=1 Tax=Aliidiomarina taiwanensis TaxID=946228 RepID=A0A432X0T3_9GAMM|nr:DUF2231 domain-containing protein [Aliidiomarina taiwanensis]RUO39780.1 hypothetical protein CWE15_08450 [Aliidiomarina taiwanensis]
MRHPLHPVLVHFPVSCWSLAVLTDIANLFFGELSWRWSNPLLLVGCGTGVVAMLAGFIEFMRVPEGAALRDAYWHMGLMALALVLFTLRLLLGIEQFQVRAPEPVLLLISGVGFLCLLVGGWFGGRLVYHHGVGQDNKTR